MPYLREAQREYFTDLLRALEHSHIADGGELNFLIAMLVKQFLDTHPLRYETFNTVIGALEAEKLEIYRRLVAPYEDKAIERNGDVYETKNV